MSPKAAQFWLHHSDAFDWLKARRAASIEAIVTDPPYGIIEYDPDQLKQRRKGRGIWRLPHNYDGYSRMEMPRFTVLTAWDRQRIREFHGKLAPRMLRVLVPGGHVFLASHNLLSHLVIEAFTEAGFELRGQVARVVRTLRGGDRPKGAHKKYPSVSVTPRSCWEPWLVFRKPCEGRVRDNLKKWKTGALRRPARDVPFADFIMSSPARGPERALASHPSLKPQAFMRQIVAAALPMGKGLICDPFCGSGSTLAAASALGIRSVGVERRREYFAMATRVIPKLARLEVADYHLNGNGKAHRNGRQNAKPAR